MVMNLSPKAIRLIVEALEHYQTSHEERLRNECLTEDEIADLTNDCQYLEAIKTDLKKYHRELLHKLSSYVQRS
jgi:predicted DNA-binding transcriptional regulator YafY